MLASKHAMMTNEMYAGVLDIFKSLSRVSGSFGIYFLPEKLPVALQALGMTELNETTLLRIAQSEGVELKEFCEIVAEYLDGDKWCANELKEAFNIFDRDGGGTLDALEMKRVFTKLGENLTDLEMEDQMREFDFDGNNQMEYEEWCKMVLSTRGVDYVLEDD